MKKTIHTVSLLMCSVVLGFGQTDIPASESHSVQAFGMTQSNGGTPTPGPLELPQFNPADAAMALPPGATNIELCEVTLRFIGDLNVPAGAFNTNPFPGNYYSASVSTSEFSAGVGGLSLDLAGDFLGSAILFSGPFPSGPTSLAPFSNLDLGALSNSRTMTVSTTSDLLTTWTGTGSLPVTTSVAGSKLSDSDPGVFVNIMDTYQGNITLLYDFKYDLITTVPEPTTYALVGLLSCLGLGFFRQRVIGRS